jgi:RluA family pseudouridine synthase
MVTVIFHKHEPPVTAEPFEVIEETEEYIVINKPASIPVHPSGIYCHNTVVQIMKREMEIARPLVVHRLDRLTSGVLILGKVASAVTKFQSLIQTHLTQKTYLARVDGRFPEDEMTIDQPLLQGSGRSRVSSRGKPAITVVTFVHYNEESDTTVLKCKPLQGRNHQIRVHLAWCGFPIVNDPLYNRRWLKTRGWTINRSANGPLSSYPGCALCNVGWRDPLPEEMLIYLHALRYQGPGFDFQTDPPAWAIGYQHQ